MEGIKPPCGLVLTGDNSNLEKFIQLFNLYITAANLQNDTEQRKIALFLTAAGEEAVEVYNSFNVKHDTLDDLLKEFKVFVQPRKNTLIKTYQFLNLKQEEAETIEQFIIRLRTLGKKCELGELENRLMTMMLIIGIKDKSLKENILRIEEVKFEDAVRMCRLAEEGKRQIKKLEGNDQCAEVDAVKIINKCRRCGNSHQINKCPAYGRVCAACEKPNHFAKQCLSRLKKNANYQKQEKNKRIVHTIEDNNSDEDFKFESVSHVHNINNLKQWKENILINDISILCKLDTGADCNTLPINAYNKINNQGKYKLLKCHKILVVYNGQKIYPKGKIELECVVKNKIYKIKFIVIDVNAPPVLGLSDCVRLNLIKKVDNIRLTAKTEKDEFICSNKDVFTGLGLIGNYKIQVQEGAQSVVKPIRRIPIAIRDRLKVTLDNYEKRGVIEKVEGPTAWCNNLVIVEKPDKSLRLCLDPKELNKSILRERYQIPSPEEIYNSLAGKEIFTVLDLKDGFFQIGLQDNDKLCTFGTPFGRYRFLRMPFGISSAPEVMQKINSQIFGEIEGVEVYYDDVIVATSDKSSHDIALRKVMEQARKYNVKFNENKVQYKLDHVKYVGLIVSKSGIQVDSDHIKAITELKEPANIKELQKFLGMCNYLSKFIPQYNNSTEPLRQLLKKDIEWCWGNSQTQAFLELKKKLCCTPTLGILSNKGFVTIQTDSSKDGMGACLLQNGRPISFYSRSYTDCQKRWAPIEKELFAICAALEKYHQFVYGRKIIVETDHKPLVTIINKDINKISARLQRMVLKLIKYELDVKYVPGPKMFIADYLSRNFVTDNAKKEPSLLEVVHSFESQGVVSDKKLKQIQNETIKDCDLSVVINWYSKGYPCNNKNIWSKELRNYYKLKSELHVKENIVYFRDRIVIPKSMRLEVLTKLHNGHIGIIKCKKRVRDMLYWPGVSRDIEEFVLKCKTCEKYRSFNCKEPLISHEIPELPFCKIGMDFATYGNQDYLIVVDYYSKWIEAKLVKDKTTDTVIKKLKTVFATHGIPKMIVCDNMPFSSYKFKQFSESMGIELIHSSPRYPQSNGLSEKAVGIFKGMLKKCKDNTDINIALLNYRSTPVAGLDYSPSQLLMSRSLRTNLPCTDNYLKPKIPMNAHEAMVNLKQKSKENYDKNVIVRKPFEEGENITFQSRPDRTWYSGQIIQKQGPRSYLVKTEKGKVIRRNQKHLNHSKNKFVVHPTVEESLPLDSGFRQQVESNSNDRVIQEENSEVMTRTGRIIRRPVRFQDYVL